jgi:mannose-6-phosphate isomerase-like protein (cupin superfamily)
MGAVDPPWQTRRLPEPPDDLAPDGSEIRFLGRVAGASMVHCSLPPGAATRAVRHRTVEEAWFFLGGSGELWRRAGAVEEVTPVRAGTAVTIPLSTSFQFRATGAAPLTFVIATAPPWPGEDEAVPVEGPWPPTVG